MLGEAAMGLSALNTAFNMAKGLKDIDDAVRRNAAVIDLQGSILSAQQAQAALVKRIEELEAQVTGFEKWEAEKEKYELKEIWPNNFAYSIKVAARGSQPPHLICPTCYEQRRKSILQSETYVHLGCPVCKMQVQFKDSGFDRGLD